MSLANTQAKRRGKRKEKRGRERRKRKRKEEEEATSELTPARAGDGDLLFTSRVTGGVAMVRKGERLSLACSESAGGGSRRFLKLWAVHFVPDGRERGILSN